MKTAHVAMALAIDLGVCLSLSAQAAITCPPMPSAVTAVHRDLNSDVTISIGTLGKLKAGELEVKTEATAKNLFAKYPNVDRLLALQTMSATYCEMLRASTLTDKERLDRWEAFQSKVLQLGDAPRAKPTSIRSPDIHVPYGDRMTVTGLAGRDDDTADRLASKLSSQDLTSDDADNYFLWARVDEHFASPALNRDDALLLSAALVAAQPPGWDSPDEPDRVELQLVADPEGGQRLDGWLVIIFRHGRPPPSATVAMQVANRTLRAPLGPIDWRPADIAWRGVKTAVHIGRARITLLLDDPTWPVLRRARALKGPDGAYSVVDIAVENTAKTPLLLESIFVNAVHPARYAVECVAADSWQKVSLNWQEGVADGLGQVNWTEIDATRVAFPADFRDAGRCNDYEFRALIPITRSVPPGGVGQILLQLMEMPKARPARGDSPSDALLASMRKLGPPAPENVIDWKDVKVAVNPTKKATPVYPAHMPIRRDPGRLDDLLREDRSVRR